MINSSRKRLNLLIVIICIPILSIGKLSKAGVGENNRETIQGELATIGTYGRLGVYAVNISGNQSIEYHVNERFPLCSTNKIMGVTAILRKSETNTGLLKKRIKYKKSELVSWSPITGKHIYSGMMWLH